MRSRAQWSYVQARLQARHGDRLLETDWHALEAARSIDQYLERTRSSPLNRFTERVNARMTSHAIEAALRGAWRAYVAEVAGLAPKDWRPAVLWAAYLPELPLIDAIVRKEAPEPILADPAFAPLVGDETTGQGGKPHRSPLAVLGRETPPSGTGKATIVERWHDHWRASWPAGRRRERDPLVELVAVVRAHFDRLGSAVPPDTSSRHRQDLARRLVRLFRRNSGSPVAVFSHLGLVALDMERLRGGLVRRLLFEPVHAKEAK